MSKYNTKSQDLALKRVKSLYLKIGESYEGRRWSVMRISANDYWIWDKKNNYQYEASYDEEWNAWRIGYMEPSAEEIMRKERQFGA